MAESDRFYRRKEGRKREKKILRPPRTLYSMVPLPNLCKSRGSSLCLTRRRFPKGAYLEAVPNSTSMNEQGIQRDKRGTLQDTSGNGLNGMILLRTRGILSRRMKVCNSQLAW